MLCLGEDRRLRARSFSHNRENLYLFAVEGVGTFDISYVGSWETQSREHFANMYGPTQPEVRAREASSQARCNCARTIVLISGSKVTLRGIDSVVFRKEGCGLSIAGGANSG
jgi:hypothetical protein